MPFLVRITLEFQRAFETRPRGPESRLFWSFTPQVAVHPKHNVHPTDREETLSCQSTSTEQ